MIEVLKAQRRYAVAPERPEYFSGTVRLHYLTRPSDPGKVELPAVFFEPGARTIPHDISMRPAGPSNWQVEKRDWDQY